MIEDFGLHDATFLAVELNWSDGTCIMEIRHSELSDCTLVFTGVSNLALQRTQPWGSSLSINSATQKASGMYEIEMQSGDLFKIDALDVKLARTEMAALPKR